MEAAMKDARMSGASFATHEVGNQSPPFQDLNLFLCDAALREAVRRGRAAASHEELAAFGAAAGSAEAFELGRLANDNPPKLRRFDPQRSEERRTGKEGVSTVRPRGSPTQTKKQKKHN